MRKFTLIILFLLGAMQCMATGISFEVPEGFRTDTLSSVKFYVEKDSTCAYIQFTPVSNLDKDKYLAAHDSVFFKVTGCSILESDIKGNADRINKYFDPISNEYVKIYRYAHNDGYTDMIAFNKTDDFAWADEIDKSLHKGLRWYEIAGLILLVLVFGFPTMGMVSYFKQNWPRFIVCALINMAFLIGGAIFMGTVGLCIWAILTVLFLFIGFLGKKGYIVIAC